MITSVIFDLDGTVVDTVDLHAQAWQEMFCEFGKGVPLEKIREQIGKNADPFLPIFWTKEELAQAEKQMSERYPRLFKQIYLVRVEAFLEVRQLFEHILKDGKEIALASSATSEELQTYKDRAEISDLIDDESSANDPEKLKSHGNVFQGALKQLGDPPPEETIVVCDTPCDIEAAGKAGLRAIAFRCGGFPDETLRGAVAIFDDPADLLAHYDDSPLAEP